MSMFNGMFNSVSDWVVKLFTDLKTRFSGFSFRDISIRGRVAAGLVVVLLVGAFIVIGVGGGDSGELTVSDEGSLVPREMPDLPTKSNESTISDVPGNVDTVVSPVDFGPDGVDRRVLVQLESSVDPESLVGASGPLAGGRILEKLSALGNVVIVEIPEGISTDDAINALSGFEGIISAEPDSVVSLSSSGSQVAPGSWGLNRIDQPTLPLDNVYNYRSAGAGVVAYVVDTGLRPTHTEFTGRTQAGYSVIDDGLGTGDCSGHGTHVAGTIAGTTFGIAKGPTVVPVRVFNCSDSGSWAGVSSGVNWIAANHSVNNPGARGVVNMSLGGSVNATADAAVNSAIGAGLPVVVAAGNGSVDACETSPARVADALTVGATNISDARASFSNFGTCLDVFAPGVDIVSAYVTSDGAVAAWGGTSMASPHVAGVAVQLLALNTGWTPAQVATEINTTAGAGQVTDRGAGSPDRLLFANPNIAASAVSTSSGDTMLINSTHSFHTVSGTPAVLYKRLTSGNSVAGSLAFSAGETVIGSAVMSSDGNTGYFAVSGTPAKIVKVNLTNMTRTSSLTLNTSENYSHAAVISADNVRGYFSTGDSPSKIVTVSLTDMTRLSSTALNYADGVPVSAARPQDGVAVFGTNTSPGKVVLVNSIGTNQSTRSGVLTLNSGENDLRSAAHIPTTSTVLFGTNTSPGIVVQVTVGGVAVRDSAVTLASGNNFLVGATVAPNKANAYFTTNTSPGRIVKVPTGL